MKKKLSVYLVKIFFYVINRHKKPKPLFITAKQLNREKYVSCIYFASELSIQMKKVYTLNSIKFFKKIKWKHNMFLTRLGSSEDFFSGSIYILFNKILKKNSLKLKIKYRFITLKHYYLTILTDLKYPSQHVPNI